MALLVTLFVVLLICKVRKFAAKASVTILAVCAVPFVILTVQPADAASPGDMCRQLDKAIFLQFQHGRMAFYAFPHGADPGIAGIVTDKLKALGLPDAAISDAYLVVADNGHVVVFPVRDYKVCDDQASTLNEAAGRNLVAYVLGGALEHRAQ